jgi:RNA polymerase sigma factor (sigma-70 family)
MAMCNNNDDVLLNELKGGNMSAYKELFLKYHKLLSLDAFNILGDEMESDDVVQVLFIEIWDRKLYLNINSSIKAYLRTSVRNKCLSRLSKNATDKRRLDTYLLDFEEHTDVDVLERNEITQGIDKIINELPGQRLHAFDLVYMQGKPYKEAAGEMGITINSLKTHLKLAVKTLKNRLHNFK